MSFFQNPFSQDFIGTWLLADRHFIQDFKCPRNAGRGDEMVVSFGQAPFNLSGNDSDGHAKNVLNLTFALNDTKNWATLPITITGGSLSAITVYEVISSLQNNTTFAGYFTATLRTDGNIQISQKKPVTSMKFYVNNGQAETVLLFNKMAGVAELPTYFARHSIDNRFNYPDGQNALVLLNVGLNVDSAVIDNAVDNKGNSLGYSHSTVHYDWQLLGGKSGLFTFTSYIYDAQGRTSQTYEYSAGAGVGDLAIKTVYTYATVDATSPSQMTQVPYTLTSNDLIVPSS
jgi:hypothetical protein